jgi:molybdate transport system substrate-binding protein
MRRIASCLLAVAAGAAASAAVAADLVLFSGGPMKTSVQPHLDAFTKATGHRVTAEFEPMGELQSRLRAGVPVDVVIMTPEAIAPMVREGRLAGDGQAPLARVGVGIAVGKDAPSPDISSPDALRRALLAARSVVYIDPTRGTSGKTVVEMFEKLGITEAMKPKTTLGSGGFVVAPVGRGEVELGIHQVSEILPVPGVKLVGELPRELQRYTTYVAALSSATKTPEAARELVRFLRGRELQATFRANGLSIPD